MPARKVERNSRQMLAVSVNASVELRLTGPDLSSSAQGLKVLELWWRRDTEDTASLLNRKMQSLEMKPAVIDRHEDID